MKNSSLLIYFFFLVQTTFSQITFEKAFHYSQSEEVALSATDDAADGYVVAIGRKRNAPTLNYTFALAHLNSYGDTIWYKTFSQSFHPEVKVIRRATDGYVVLGIADDTTQLNPYMYWLTKFDTSGNLIWSNYYSSPLLVGIEDRVSMDITSIGNYFISTGYPIFFTVNSSGIIINIGTANPQYGQSVGDYQSEKLLKKNNLYNFSFGFTTNPPYNVHPKILRVDENADTLYSYSIDLDSSMRDPRILKLTSNGLLIGGFSFYGMGNLYLSRIDSIGNNTWIKRVYGKAYWNCYFTSNTLTSEGNIVLSGFHKPNTGKAFLSCFNENGDSLWYKEFSPSDTSLKTEFYDVIATADSGILACGQLMRPNGSRESYIVKLDANGNLFNPLSVIEKSKETYLHLYPNPSSSYTNIHYLGNEKEVVVNITGIDGKSLGSWQMANKDSRITITTSRFAPGIYFCSVSKDGRVLQTRKMVVFR